MYANLRDGYSNRKVLSSLYEQNQKLMKDLQLSIDCFDLHSAIVHF